MEDPNWFDEAYSAPIASLDTGAVQRNLSVAPRLAAAMISMGLDHLPVVDIGGGTGLLTRLLRDVGFDCYWEDKYCENIYALGFDSSDAPRPVGSLILVEVFEHLTDPIGFLSRLVHDFDPDAIFLTTLVYPVQESGEPVRSDDWWYYAPQTGQHVGFPSPKTLQYIANEMGMRVHSVGMYHVMTRRDVPRWKLRLALSRIGSLGNHWARIRLGSRTTSDFDALLR